MNLENLKAKMECQKSSGKLTRANSSLLRSSPTVRSSIHSFSSVDEIGADEETSDLEEQKPHRKPVPQSVRCCSAPVLVILLLLVYIFFAFFNWNDIAASENLLLALILIAALLYFIAKNKESCDDYARRFGITCFSSKAQSKPVQWLIGEANPNQTGRLNRVKRDGSVEKIVREGVEFYSNGDFYEGEFHKGRCNGSGVYNYSSKGSRYEGDWIDGRYDGYGIESRAKGSRYRGQYRQGLRHGYGVYKFYTGDSFAGEWCNGQSHGIGVQTCANGSCYVGEFKFGVKHGLGCYHFRNGDRYAGEYFEDKIHGFGIYHFANSHHYEGSWHEGRKQGYGMYTFRSGETKSGEWDNGNLKAPFPSTSELVLRAVQAARRTADNAILLRHVDKQVNEAKTAAKKAASAARVAAIKAVQNRMNGKFCNTTNKTLVPVNSRVVSSARNAFFCPNSI